MITANVSDDWLVHQLSNPSTRAIAGSQLTTIARIDADEEMSDRDKCEKLLGIIKCPPEGGKFNRQQSS